MKMWGLTRKLCSGSSSSVPILCRGRGRAFCTSSPTATATEAPLLMIHTRNLFTSYRNGRLKDSFYPYCLFSLADMDSAAGTKKKRVLLPEDNLSPLEKHEFFPDDLRFVGSAHGWVGCANPRDRKLFLFNPLSPSDSITLLPPFPELTRYSSVSNCKLIMSAPPSDPSCRVLASYGSDELCFWKPGDTSWTPLPPHPNPDYADAHGYAILYSSHRRCFYIFYRTALYGCFLDAWDLSGSPARTTLVIGDVTRSPGAVFGYHLAEPPSGELFLVVKELFGGKLTDEFDSSWRTRYPNYLGLRPEHLEHEFYVFKVDFEHPNRGEGDDHGISFLGGDALFLGKNDSFWVSGRDFPVEPSSIYFTESDYLSYHQFDAFDRARHGGCDMLTFQGTPRTTNRYYFRDAGKKSIDFTPIWVMPRPESSSMTSLIERFVATPEYKPKPRRGY